MAKCTDCGQEHDVTFIHASCHTEAPTWVEIHDSTRTAIVRCSICNNYITTLELRILPW